MGIHPAAAQMAVEMVSTKAPSMTPIPTSTVSGASARVAPSRIVTWARITRAQPTGLCQHSNSRRRSVMS